jgi:hypothetical protein
MAAPPGRRQAGLSARRFWCGVTAAALGLLESVIGGESGHHVRMSGHEDPRLTPGTSDRVSMSDRFQFHRRRTV